MKKQSVKQTYNQLFNTTPMPFGHTPHRIIESLLEYIQTGSAVEYGSGDGRNCLCLAEAGFKVTAIDLSQEALNSLKSRDMTQTVKTQCGDFTRLKKLEPADISICISTLHHLDNQAATLFLDQLCDTIPSNRFLAIATFINRLKVFDPSTDSDAFLPTYPDWVRRFKQFETLREFVQYNDGITLPISNRTDVAVSLLLKKK